MATELQKKALDTLVEVSRTKKRVLKGEVLKIAGYKKGTQIKPNQVFESKGFLELCDEIGLTDNFLTKALLDDIKAKPKKREKELRLAFQVKGKLTEKNNGGHSNNFFFISPEQQQAIARRVITGGEQSETASS